MYSMNQAVIFMIYYAIIIKIPSQKLEYSAEYPFLLGFSSNYADLILTDL